MCVRPGACHTDLAADACGVALPGSRPPPLQPVNPAVTACWPPRKILSSQQRRPADGAPLCLPACCSSRCVAALPPCSLLLPAAAAGALVAALATVCSKVPAGVLAAGLLMWWAVQCLWGCVLQVRFKFQLPLAMLGLAASAICHVCRETRGECCAVQPLAACNAVTLPTVHCCFEAMFASGSPISVSYQPMSFHEQSAEVLACMPSCLPPPPWQPGLQQWCCATAPAPPPAPCSAAWLRCTAAPLLAT